VARGPLAGSTRALLVSWACTITAIVLLSAGKREVYLLPVHPAIALLVAGGLLGPIGPRLGRILRATTSLYAPLLALLALAALALAAGLDPAVLLRGRLEPEDALSAGALASLAARHRPAFVALGALTLALAAAAWRVRAAGAFARLVPVAGAALALWALAFQTAIHPEIARTRSFASFLAVIDPLVPPGEPLYAYYPVHPAVRFYALRAIAPWRARPDDRDLHLLAWEREVDALERGAVAPLERLAVAQGRYGRRGALVLVRVPPGALPPRPAPAPQNG
jgi:hypothetical protein